MQFLKYLLITAIILALVIPETEEAKWRRFKKKAKKWWRRVKKPLCKALFTVACPAAAIGTAAALSTITSGAGGAVAIAAAEILITAGCTVGKKKCKRSVLDNEYILIPFSDNFDNYDYNGDKMIEYHEFMQAVTSSVGLIHPDELLEPFVFADADGNDMIDTDEFQGAPFLFGQLYVDDLLKLMPTQTMG